MKVDRCLKVVWIDTQTKSGWLDESELIDKPCTASTVGWLVSENEAAITLAQSYIKEHDQVGEIIVIPKVAITWIIDLGSAEEEKANG